MLMALPFYDAIRARAHICYYQPNGTVATSAADAIAAMPTKIQSFYCNDMIWKSFVAAREEKNQRKIINIESKIVTLIFVRSSNVTR